jgi:hypothetical protein
MKTETRYVNTDLDVVAPCDLGPLVSALERRCVSPLHVSLGEDGQGRATFETDRYYEHPEQTIAALLDAVESLAGAALDVWNVCTVREFDLGYDCGEVPWKVSVALAHGTVQRVSTAGISFRITLYGGEGQSDAREGAGGSGAAPTGP